MNRPNGLPDTKYMLHNKAYRCNAYPAGESHNDRFAAGFNQLYDIGIQTDGSHGKDDEELAQLLDGENTAELTPKDTEMVVMIEAAMK